MKKFVYRNDRVIEKKVENLGRMKRFETYKGQPEDVHEEKRAIYVPTIPYYKDKYQPHDISVTGLMFGARGTIPNFSILPTDTRKEMDNESDDSQFSENEILSVLCFAFKTGETSVNINKGVLPDNSNAKENLPSGNGLLQIRDYPSSVTGNVMIVLCSLGTEFGVVKASIGIYTVICLQPFIPSPPLHDILAGLYKSTTGERDSCRIRTSTCRFAVQSSEVQIKYQNSGNNSLNCRFPHVQFLRDGGHG
ncbi:hypothetical protein ANN_12963 [Periplaneta americana]|uniref:Uncharacterized protein n=1 Tax=Periplaneta americana TaxID=6978 RepID=A0ABQ8TK75_PERAM|nr:hypothetical protein ANN_12963 [Periplaneta americana]